MLSPAITRYRQIGMDVGTPSVDSGLVKDLYVTLEPGAVDGGSEATIRAFVKPLVLWMWLGGAVMALGTLLAAFPGSRLRRPTDPVSAPSRHLGKIRRGRRHGLPPDRRTRPTTPRSGRPSMSEAPRRGRAAPFVAVAVAVVCAGLFFVLAGADRGKTETADTPLLGEPAPEAVGEQADGAVFDLARRKGSWVVVNFFDPECVPCVEEHPELLAFDAQERQLGGAGQNW